MNDTESFKRAHSTALRFISYRPRSEAEVRTRLQRRFPAPVVERVIESLAEGALIDDSRFAELWKESRNSHRPRSSTTIRRELISKGIARDIAEAVVGDLDDDESAHRAGLKMTRRLADADFPTFKRRLWAYLQRRGYSPSVVRRAILQLWDRQHPPPV